MIVTPSCELAALDEERAVLSVAAALAFAIASAVSIVDSMLTLAAVTDTRTLSTVTPASWARFDAIVSSFAAS